MNQNIFKEGFIAKSGERWGIFSTNEFYGFDYGKIESFHMDFFEKGQILSYKGAYETRDKNGLLVSISTYDVTNIVVSDRKVISFDT